MWPSMPISCAYVSPSVHTHVCAMFIIASKLLLFFTWGDCSSKYHCTKTMLTGGACNLWGGLCFLQNLWSPTASKHVCDVSEMSRCTRPSCLWQGCPVWAQYRLPFGKPDVSDYRLQMDFGERKWAFWKRCGSMFYLFMFQNALRTWLLFFLIILSMVSRNKQLKPVWTPSFLSLCILTIQYSTVVQDRRTERQSW